MDRKEAQKQLESMKPIVKKKFELSTRPVTVHYVEYYTKSQVELLLDVVCEGDE